MTGRRPWGNYLILDEGPEHKVKRISVLPGRRLSYQLHHHRSEHWFVVQGRGIATVGDSDLEMKVGVAVDVPSGIPHRVFNTGNEELVLIEVQHGTYSGEDDIVRLADDFGRPCEPSSNEVTADS